mmetsp:Transcript_10412/g.24777  ORF Transcript_10412/g.24777 Transcript_10412/m.24777 type:complete len:90 (-) Transcript_10412:65-334(-)
MTPLYSNRDGPQQSGVGDSFPLLAHQARYSERFPVDGLVTRHEKLEDLMKNVGREERHTARKGGDVPVALLVTLEFVGGSTIDDGCVYG